MYDVASARNQECDMVCDSYEYLRGTQDNWNVRHSLCTVKFIQCLYVAKLLSEYIFIIYANNLYYHISLPYVHFVVELANTCCTLHSERTCHGHRLYIYHNHRNGIDFYPHHQKDYIPGMCICQIDNGNFDKWLEQVDEYRREHISIL